jgi:16S rRNA G1207 methylase RsmC
VECYGSVGYDDVRGSFDVVVANVPGHASAGVIGHFVADAGNVLVRGGYAAFVVVDPLADAIESNLAEVVRRVDDRGHTVLVAQFPPAAEDRSSDRDRYRRGIREFGAHGHTWRVGTAEGVPEFERMSHHTTAVLDYLEAVESGPRVAVWNPGQGHIPIFLAARQQRSVLQLADRDLLALRFTDGNLAGNRVRPDPTILVHGLQVAADGGPFDLVVDVLRRSEPPAAAVARIVHARSLLAEGGAVVISGPGQSPRRAAAGLEEQGVPVRRKPARRSLVLTVG